MSAKNTTGRLGEEYAARYLEENGYRIIKRNFKSRTSEIDIIAIENNTLCFIEVKTRNSKDFGYASEAVDYHKRQKMILGARSFLVSGKVNMPSRFDVVEVYGNLMPGGFSVNEINVIKNAFEA